MNIDLKGRNAVVTGSTAGIGRAIAEGLAQALLCLSTAVAKRGSRQRYESYAGRFRTPTAAKQTGFEGPA